MDFIYAAGAKGFYGEGYFYHRFFDFPDFPFVTKTITFNPKRGCPFCVLMVGKSVINRIKLYNKGFQHWCANYARKCGSHNTISIYPESENELDLMIYFLKYRVFPTKPVKVEVNLSCPNIGNVKNISITPISDIDIWLKLRYDQNPFDYISSPYHIKGIRLNAVPSIMGGISGERAKEKNWSFIERYSKLFNVSGCSWNSEDDLKYLKDMGCKEISIGSVMLTNPHLVEKLNSIDL